MLTRLFVRHLGAQQVQFRTAVFPGGDAGDADNVTLVDVSAASSPVADSHES